MHILDKPSSEAAAELAPAQEEQKEREKVGKSFGKRFSLLI